MHQIAYVLHSLSPLHAGTGQSVGVIDLPIARMRSTGIPYLPGSSIKGVLREARRGTPHEKAIFGPEKSDDLHAGALIVSDARLLALPVRSFHGTFAWVTSPLLLTLARRDLSNCAGCPEPVSQMTNEFVRVTEASVNLLNDHIYLEDLDLKAQKDGEADAWGEFIASLLNGDEQEGLSFARRFAIVDDEKMAFLFETATQIDVRVRIDSDTGTAADGQLWSEESLPPETLLVGEIFADRVRNGAALTPPDVIQETLGQTETLQFGGKATVGRGICRLIPVSQEARAQ